MESLACTGGRAGPALVALAELSARLPHRTGDGLAVLLKAAQPFDDGFAPLRPLWTREAIHRALDLLELFTALGRRASSCRADGDRLAHHLASVLAPLETTDLTRIVPCSGALCAMAHDLVALFGPATGRVMLDTDVAAISLAAYQRRALMLLTHKLIANALLHAFVGRAAGRISLRLERLDRGCARLVVGDDGIGCVRGWPSPAKSVAGSLSDLLEGELRYCSSAQHGTQAELVFPDPGGPCKISRRFTGRYRPVERTSPS